MNTPAIQTHQLMRRYGEMAAAGRLTLTVAQGRIFGFLGYDGAGKTTTISMLTTLLEQCHNEVRACVS